MEAVINEGTQFEITAKAKLNFINKFLSNAFPSQTKVKEQSSARNETVKLSKLEISKFHDNSTARQEFTDSFNAVVHNSKSL